MYNASDIFDDESFNEYLEEIKKYSAVNNYYGMQVTVHGRSGWYYDTFKLANTDIETIKCASVSDIGCGTFYNCIKLSSAEFMTSNQYNEKSFIINDYAFYNCIELQQFTTVGGYYKIGKEAFANCYKLSTITGLLNNIGFIDDCAFENCYSLNAFIQLNASVSMYSIGSNAFKNCYNIQGYVGTFTKFIGRRAFYNCSSLSVFVVSPSSYMSIIIDDEALAKTNISNVNITPNVSYIGNKCFAECYNLETATLSGCDYIGDSIFYKCSKLSIIELNDLFYVRSSAFTSLSNLWYISLPKVIDIGADVFKDCIGLSAISTGQCYLPLCEEIESTTFANCNNIAYISLPNLKQLPDDTFCNDHTYSMSKISYIDLGNCVSIGNWNFYKCSLLGLSSIISINGNCRYIGHHAFGYTGISLFYLGSFGYSFGINNVLSIGSYAFEHCSRLGRIDFSKCAYIGEHAFDGCTPSLIFLQKITKFPDGFSEEGHKFINTFLISIDYMYKVSSSYFKNAPSLSYVYLNNCSIIEDDAFYGCSKLQTINLQGDHLVSLKSINAFNNCNSDYCISVYSSLYSLYITDSVWGLISSHIYSVSKFG